ncbi:MAG: zf-HC2 domain-containing protein [Acidimicrobiales bacterium]
MTHPEIEELLGAYALDAVSPEERDEIEAHLPECPRCQQEVTAHLQVTGMLGSLGGSAPVGLWDRIAGELAIGSGGPLEVGSAQRVPAELSPGLQAMAPVLALDDARSNLGTKPGRAGRSGARRASRSTLAVASVAAALLVIVGLLSATVVNLNHRVSRLQSAVVSGGVSGQVTAALADPRHQTVQLAAAVSGQPWRAEVVLDQGKAFLVPGEMPSISSADTFQAWAVVSGKYVSLGVIGSRPGDVQLQLQHGMSQVLVNVEPEGGTAQPTNPVLLAAALPSSV